MISKILPAGPFNTNTILLACSKTKEGVVIDPAYGVSAKILQEIQKNDLKITKILLTHSHWDHIADVHQLKQCLSAAVYVHKDDAPNLENPGADGLPEMLSIKSVKADNFLEDKQIISIGQLNIEVIHTPGHTPGSVCFYLNKQQLLISGDTLFKGSIGNISFPGSQPKKMWVSLKKLAQLPPTTKIFPGHGQETTIQQEAWLERAEEIFSQ